jgi:ABC-2 type transport system ATP-binding protein
VVSLGLDGAGTDATRSALEGLPGLERVAVEIGQIALYVEDGAGSVAEIVRRLESSGIRAGAISVSRPTLDDVFLRATGRRLEGDSDAHIAEGGAQLQARGVERAAS